MLMDVIGVVIGFSVIMLLLSLIVTSLSQATQALLRLRGRNLRYGLATALTSDKSGVDKASLQDAADLMNRCDDAALRRQADTQSFMSRLIGPAVSWIENDTLRSVLLEKAQVMAGDSLDQIDSMDIDKTTEKIIRRFNGLEKSLTNRFEKIMRGVSLVCALVVAAVFQISTPLLIKQLSTDPLLRTELVAATPIVFEQVGEKVQTQQNRKPQMTDIAVIEGAQERIDQLSLINITPMRYGTSFYIDDPRASANIIGVLVTAILLTLGAPFWYKVLGTAVNWRDLYAPKNAVGANEPPVESP